MPQSAHARAAEFHLLAAHAHESAATHHEKGDHLSGHEASRQAHEHAKQAWQWSQTASQKSAATKGLPATATLPFGQSAPHPDNDAHAVSGFNPTLTTSAANKAAGLPDTKPKPLTTKSSSAKKTAPKKSVPAKKKTAPKRKK